MEPKKGDAIEYTGILGVTKGKCISVHKLCIVVEHIDLSRTNVAYAFINKVNGKDYWTKCNGEESKEAPGNI